MTTRHGLTPEQLGELEADLLRERARLERTMSAETEASGSTAGGTARRVPGTAERGLAQALEARAHARYRAILDALTRVAAGTYGTCAKCANAIPYGRLSALPEAAHCVACGSYA